MFQQTLSFNAVFDFNRILPKRSVYHCFLGTRLEPFTALLERMTLKQRNTLRGSSQFDGMRVTFRANGSNNSSANCRLQNINLPRYF